MSVLILRQKPCTALCLNVMSGCQSASASFQISSYSTARRTDIQLPQGNVTQPRLPSWRKWKFTRNKDRRPRGSMTPARPEKAPPGSCKPRLSQIPTRPQPGPQMSMLLAGTLHTAHPNECCAQDHASLDLLELAHQLESTVMHLTQLRMTTQEVTMLAACFKLTGALHSRDGLQQYDNTWHG